MAEYAIIAQNDESQWDDIKGDLYHYPNTYQKILTPGCKIIYYKGRMKNKAFEAERLSPEPHYFGAGIIGNSIEDTASSKKDFYCEILDYQEFKQAVPSKIDDQYLEDIPESRQNNYWRFGVREVSKEVYERILNHTALKKRSIKLPKISGEFESYGPIEGTKKQRYTTYYERNPIHRQRAIDIHGLSCMGCGFNFEETYGKLGSGFIHVHHNKPVSETGPSHIDPATDLSVLCPNCHAMVHRKKNTTLSLSELKEIIAKSA